jgi:hypothetical protein
MTIIRNCDNCTKCCEGWLWGEAHGHKFWPGRPCHYVSKNGCSIYEDRPETPCKSFKCEWLVNNDIPEWMKPDVSNVIIRKTTEKEKEFIEFTEAGSRLDVAVLSWIFMNYADGKIKNAKYQIDGGWNYIFGK